MASSSATVATTVATTFSSRATSSSWASSSSTSNARPSFRARRRPDLPFRRVEPRRTRAASKDDDVLWCADGDEPNSVPWHRISPRYEATEEDAVADGALLELLSPAWRILLLSDGSVTRHLRLLCPRLRQTRLECLRQGPVPSPSQVGVSAAGLGMPDDCDLIAGPMVQREVLLHISRGDFFADDHYLDAELNDGELAKEGDVPMVYAASWWSEDNFRKYMVDGSSPMWSNLRRGNVELYREVRRVYMGDNEELARIFGCDGPFWARHYIFWHDQKPMTVVYEVFNPALERQLGPAKPGVRYL